MEDPKIEQFALALSRYTRRKYEKCIEVCDQQLNKQKLDMVNNSLGNLVS